MIISSNIGLFISSLNFTHPPKGYITILSSFHLNIFDDKRCPDSCTIIIKNTINVSLNDPVRISNSNKI